HFGPQKGSKNGQKPDFGSKMAIFGHFWVFRNPKSAVIFCALFWRFRPTQGYPLFGVQKGSKKGRFWPFFGVFLGSFQAILPPKGVFFDPFWGGQKGAKKCKKGGDHRVWGRNLVQKRAKKGPKRGQKPVFWGFAKTRKVLSYLPRFFDQTVQQKGSILGHFWGVFGPPFPHKR